MQRKQQEPRIKTEHPTYLSTIITSLLSAFESTRHLYHRIKNDTRSSTKKLNKRSPSVGAAVTTPQTADEQQLQLHLQRAPAQIAKIFKTNSERLGDGYRRGDERAKTSLNRILLILNTGLTKIISSLLRKNNGVGNDNMIRELMSLSDRSARDSLTELEGFRMRLESMSSLALSGGGSSSVGQDGALIRGRRRCNPGLHGKAVRGQVDRQKATSTRQIGGVRTTTQGRNVSKKSITPGTSYNSTATKTKRSTNSKRINELPEIHPVWVRSKNSSSTSIHLRRMNQRTNPANDDDKTSSGSQPPRTTTAVTNSPTDLTLPTSNSARHRVPEMQGEAFLTGRAEASLDRRISILSHGSGSTKLGEIPQHKWISPWVPPVEVDEESGEEDIPENDESNGRTGKRFWRRFGRNRT